MKKLIALKTRYKDITGREYSNDMTHPQMSCDQVRKSLGERANPSLKEGVGQEGVGLLVIRPRRRKRRLLKSLRRERVWSLGRQEPGEGFEVVWAWSYDSHVTCVG